MIRAGDHHFRPGLWRDQIDWATEGLQVARVAGRRKDEGTLLNNIGLVYDRLDQGEKALDYYRQALLITEKVGDRYGESITRYNMATIYRRQGRLAEAVAELKRAAELARSVQSPHLERHVATLAQVEAELAEKVKGQ